VQFQKTSTPTPGKVNGNSYREGEGGSKTKIFEREVELKLNQNEETFHGQGMDIFWNNTLCWKLNGSFSFEK